jgi:hypothetical protein
MTTNDITAFLDSQAARIKQLEAQVAGLTEELEALNQDVERRLPEYRGFEFWLTELFPGYGNETSKAYGYSLRGVGSRDGHNEGGGAYATKHEATKAAFARIETLTFDR